MVPRWVMQGLSEELPLSTERVVLFLGEEELPGVAELTFVWAPFPHTKARITTGQLDPKIEWVAHTRETAEFELILYGTKTRALLMSFNSRLEGQSVRLALDAALPEFEHGDGPFTRVQFSIANFRRFFGTWIKTGDHAGRAGRLTFRHDGWVVVVENAPNLDDLQESRKRLIGHAITHNGYFQREDDKPFRVLDADRILSALLGLLCLAHGAWAPYIMPVGLDSSGVKVWERWYIPKGDPWTSPSNWFDWTHPDGLDQMFGHILNGCANDDWKRAFENALFWYDQIARNSAPNATLLLAQTGLEILSWYRFVTAGSEPAATFDKKPAAYRIRRLLQEYSIPVGIPEELGALSNLAFSEGWSDGPHATTALRNLDVHPKGNSAPFEVVNEASTLTLWHFELCLLAFAGYGGVYRNRTQWPRSDSLEYVPWVVGPSASEAFVEST